MIKNKRTDIEASKKKFADVGKEKNTDINTDPAVVTNTGTLRNKSRKKINILFIRYMKWQGKAAIFLIFVLIIVVFVCFTFLSEPNSETIVNKENVPKIEDTDKIIVDKNADSVITFDSEAEAQAECDLRNAVAMELEKNPDMPKQPRFNAIYDSDNELWTYEILY